MVKISIGISTVRENIEIAKMLAREIYELSNPYIHEIVILSQREVFEDEIKDGDKCHIFRTRDSGLSNSRNFLIENLSGDYIWLLDDDVVLSFESINEVFSSIEEGSYPDIVVGKIACSDSQKYRFYKNYKKREGISGLLSTSSIEMLLKTAFLRENKVKFNKDFGLGAKYPCGEENDFLVRCFKRGASVLFSSKTFVFHPCSEKHQSPFSYFKKKEHIIPKIALIRQLPFFFSISYSFKVFVVLLLFVRSPRLAFFFLKEVFMNKFLR